MQDPLDAAALVSVYCDEHSCSSSAKELLTLAASDAGLTRETLWKNRDTPPSEDLHRELCGFIVYAIAHMLTDHRLTDNEHDYIARLKHLLFVEEGNLLGYHYDAIADILGGEIALILQDADTDAAEDIHQVHLQKALDLSYDQYLSLSQIVVGPIAERIVAPLRGRDFVPNAEKENAYALLRRLNTVIPLNPETFEINWGEAGNPSGRLSNASVPGRELTQVVKDAVWRRDQGRCAQCGSQQQLEFDHIVPFAKGGSNTYRNIQLLCSSCNRAKAARIG